MTATYMLRKHLRSQELANRPEAVAARAGEIEAAQLAAADMKARFPQITSESFEAADRYHKERLRIWRAALSN